MKVSLIIPTYKREALFVDCLRCALNQDFDSYEVIVVDQTKDHEPATQQFLDNNRVQFTYIFSEVPSAQRARNLGLERATGEVLVVIDDDTTFDPNFLHHHYNAIQSGLDVIQGRITEPNEALGKHPRWMHNHIKVRGSDNCETDGPSNNITGANFSFSRRVYEKIGGFDERFHGPVLDDGDFAQRAWRAGFKMGFVAKAAVFHHVSQQGGHGDSKLIHFTRAYHRCNLLFARKHYPAHIRWYLVVRLWWRGVKDLNKTIQAADREAVALLNGSVQPFELSK
jgi:glycosyltransferase involved in cell wall biosynthesis